MGSRFIMLYGNGSFISDKPSPEKLVCEFTKVKVIKENMLYKIFTEVF